MVGVFLQLMELLIEREWKRIEERGPTAVGRPVDFFCCQYQQSLQSALKGERLAQRGDLSAQASPNLPRLNSQTGV
ncbi:hypothetical protein PPACK8108_LOCUS18341 [Phakopsora pachyrhizi]|uniref:Uncharacterized protein n=1 Tax=Phakopsora pachyrhizi TaxID=170000 RepID=A0AAV0BD90_PHAPC|nr:hypothetical protein PPACK8108_LOCUS18341 [Phakopsora pachyrhizi]